MISDNFRREGIRSFHFSFSFQQEAKRRKECRILNQVFKSVIWSGVDAFSIDRVRNNTLDLCKISYKTNISFIETASMFLFKHIVNESRTSRRGSRSARGNRRLRRFDNDSNTARPFFFSLPLCRLLPSLRMTSIITKLWNLAAIVKVACTGRFIIWRCRRSDIGGQAKKEGQAKNTRGCLIVKHMVDSFTGRSSVRETWTRMTEQGLRQKKERD